MVPRHPGVSRQELLSVPARSQLYSRVRAFKRKCLGFGLVPCIFPASVSKQLELYLQQAKQFVSSEAVMSHIAE